MTLRLHSVLVFIYTIAVIPDSGAPGQFRRVVTGPGGVQAGQSGHCFCYVLRTIGLVIFPGAEYVSVTYPLVTPSDTTVF